jgi:hypothetical protein
LEEDTKRLDTALADVYEALKRNDQRPSGELARESRGVLQYMMAKFDRIQKAAIALLIETYCVAREPVERWPVRLKMDLSTMADKDLDETVESAFEGYRAEAIRAWNLISDPPRRSPTTQQPLYTSKPPSTSSLAFKIKVQGHENQDVDQLLSSLHRELSVALAKVRMIGTLLRTLHGLNASYYSYLYDPRFTSLKQVASELSSRFDLLRCYFTNLSY